MDTRARREAKQPVHLIVRTALLWLLTGPVRYSTEEEIILSLSIFALIALNGTGTIVKINIRTDGSLKCSLVEIPAINLAKRQTRKGIDVESCSTMS